jgi:hypothetical protein
MAEDQAPSMSNPEPVPFIATAAAGVVGLLASILAANPAIEKRLARVVDVEREIGLLPPTIRYLYVYPQGIYRWTLLCLSLAGLVMALAYVVPSEAARSFAKSLWSTGFVAALVVLWVIVSSLMMTNALSRLGIWITRALTSLPPIQTTFNIRPLTTSPHWVALNTLVELNENAKPLVVNRQAAEGLADRLIQVFQTEPNRASNRASAPSISQTTTDQVIRAKLGNALLVGCIIEGAHYVPNAGFPQRKFWGPFYDSVGELATETNLTDPSVIRSSDLETNVISLLNEINRRLELKNDERVPDSPLMFEWLKETFRILIDEYHGDVTEIDPQSDGFFRSRMEIIEERVAALPGLRSEGMQAQFVKLAPVWGVWVDLPLLVFKSPFSKRITALLMDRGVIRAMADVKKLGFDLPEDQALYRAATDELIRRCVHLVELQRSKHESWLPLQSRGTPAERFRWWVGYEVDFRLWDFARRLHQNETVPGDRGLTNWRELGGEIVRI